MLLTLVPDPLRWSVGDPHADSSKTSLELSFRSGAPSDVPPSAIGQHVFSRHREDVRNVPLTGTAASGNRPELREVPISRNKTSGHTTWLDVERPQLPAGLLRSPGLVDLGGHHGRCLWPRRSVRSGRA